MKKPVYRVMQNPYNEVGTRKIDEAKCKNTQCDICNGNRIVFVWIFSFFPTAEICKNCKGRGFKRVFVGGGK